MPTSQSASQPKVVDQIVHGEGTPTVTPSLSEPLQLQRPAILSLKKQQSAAAVVLARVGGTAITEADVIRLADTPELQRSLLSVLEAFALPLGIIRNESESAPQLLARVAVVAEKRGQSAQLEDRLEAERERARMRALMTLVNIATLRTALADAGVTTASSDSTPPALQEKTLFAAYAALLARDHGLSRPDEKIADQIEQMLATGFEAALWAPYQRLVQTALPELGDRDRSHVLGFLSQQYFPVYGVYGIAQAGEELRANGLAAELIRLIRATGRLQWTVADLDAASRTDQGLAPLVNKLLGGVADRLAFGNARVDLKVGASGLTAVIEQASANPILAELKSGALSVAWVPTPTGISLAVGSSTPGVAMDEQQASATARQISGQLAEVAHRLRQSNKPLKELVGASPLHAVLGADAIELVAMSPCLARELHAEVLERAMDGDDWTAVERKLASWELPNATIRELSGFWLRARVLFEAQPIPNTMRDIIAGKVEAQIPLAANAKLDQTAQQALAAVQQMLTALGVFAPGELKLGVLDQKTLKQLRGLNPRGGHTYVLNHSSARELFASVASILPIEERLLGDVVLRHPALWEHRAHRGTAEPLRLVLAYLKAQGFAVSVEPVRIDAALFRALDESCRLPLDPAALKTAEVEAGRLRAMPEAETLGALATKVGVSTGRTKTYVAAGVASEPERVAMLRRIDMLSQPQAERDVARSDLGMLPLKEPIVALKLVVSKLAGKPLPVGTDGVIEGTLTADELLVLRDMAHANADRKALPPSFAAFTRVAGYVHNGSLTLADLTRTIPGETQMARDVNLVVGQLRQMVQAVRMSTVPTDRAQSAVALQKSQFDPIARLPRPLLEATRLLAKDAGTAPPDARRLVTLGGGDLARLTALATEAAKRQGTDDAAQEARTFADASQKATADIERVRRALAERRLVITEGQIASTPRDPTLEADAERVVALVLQGGELLQSEARRNNEGLGGQAVRAGLSAMNNLFRLPGFADAVPFNAVQDWTLVALKIEMASAGKGTKVAADAAARAALTHVDAAVLRYLVEKHGDALGRSVAETVISGIPGPLPSAAEAHALLGRLAERMEKGGLASWPSLNVTVSDTDPEVRTAKALIQAALRHIHGGKKLWGGLVPGRDVGAIRELANRLVGLEGVELAPFLKGFLIQEGLVGVAEVGALRDPTFAGKALQAAIRAAEMGVRSYAKASPETAAELKAAEKVLRAAADKGQSVQLGAGGLTGHTRESKALGSVVRAVVMSLGSAGEMGSFDFHAMLAHVPGDVRVRSPVATVVGSEADPKSVSDASARVGERAAWDVEAARWQEQWKDRVEFDPQRAVETAAASFVLFKHMMHTMISYDLWVAPFVKSGAAVNGWVHATIDKERDEATLELTQTWSRWLDMQAMFTAFHTPVGFSQDILNEVDHGRLDVALGKATVFAPMMALTTKAMIGGVKGLRQRLVYRGKPFEVVGLANSEAVAVAQSPGAPVSTARAGAAKVAQGVGAVTDVLRDPKQVTIEPMKKGLGWLRDKVGPSRYVKFGPAESAVVLAVEDRQWIAEHPNGRLLLTLKRGSQEVQLSLLNRDLVEMSKHGDGAIPRALAERMGITSGDAAQLARAVAPLAENLPSVSAEPAAEFPSLKELSSKTHARGSTTWKVNLGGQVQELTLKNSTLVDLMRKYYSGDGKGYLRALSAEGLAEQELGVRAVLGNYSSCSLSEIKAADRAAWALNTRERRVAAGSSAAERRMDPTNDLMAAGIAVSQSVKVPGRLYPDDIRRNPRGGHQGFAEAHIADYIEPGRYNEHNARFIADALDRLSPQQLEELRHFTNPEQNPAAGLKAIEARLAQLQARVAAGSTSPEALKAESATIQDKLQRATKAANDVGIRTKAAMLGARLQLTQLEFRAATLVRELKAAGVKGATARVVQGTVTSLKGQLKSPSFYLMISLGSQQFLVDVGHIRNDDSLSELEKLGQYAVSAAVAGGQFAVGLVLFSAAGRLAPRVMRAANPALIAYTALSAERMVSDVVDAMAGYKSSLVAMRHYQAIGIPEAGFFKIDEKLHKAAALGYTAENDVETLEKNAANLHTTRTALWYFNEQSPLHDRLRQLANRAPTDPSPVRQPQDIDVAKVKSYREPIFPSVHFLERLKSLRDGKEHGSLKKVALARDFDLAGWRGDVRDAGMQVIHKLEPEPGKPAFLIDAEALRALLAKNDSYAPLDAEERQAIDRRLAIDVAQVTRWTALLNAMAISAEAKQAALLQLIENMAANHLTNSILFAYVPQKNNEMRGGRIMLYSQIDAPKGKAAADDYYTVADGIR
ncbi:MAG: hypothetical protein HY903_17790 [Deltaproteobacteria bacterium]|nr:hypothetical protein [Deltaproteobacteria bacterium]